MPCLGKSKSNPLISLTQPEWSILKSNMMEFSNIRTGSEYHCNSKEIYSPIVLITYGASDKHHHMDPYGHHSKDNDNTKFRVIFEGSRLRSLDFGSVSHVLANMWKLAGEAKKIDLDWSKQLNNDKLESQRGHRAVQQGHLAGLPFRVKQNKHKKHWAKCFVQEI